MDEPTLSGGSTSWQQGKSSKNVARACWTKTRPCFGKTGILSANPQFRKFSKRLRTIWAVRYGLRLQQSISNLQYILLSVYLTRPFMFDQKCYMYWKTMPFCFKFSNFNWNIGSYSFKKCCLSFFQGECLKPFLSPFDPLTFLCAISQVYFGFWRCIKSRDVNQ